MITISGYRILKQIYESSNSQVYRGTQEVDNQPVILKLLRAEYPSPERIRQYKLEYEVVRSLNLDSVVRAYDLQPYKNTFAIIFEDFGGDSLRCLMNDYGWTVSLDQFFNIAIQITESLGDLHSVNIIHKDINPSNIVFNPETNELKLIDLGISTVLSRETMTLRNLNVLEGTLAYMSPEQTGRMNRALDYRTDFYSLGVTFYELLANRLPFDVQDAMELVHCHIAKQPIPLHKIDPEIPKTVSRLIMKLMAKTAEERYQSALGIKADLEICLKQLRTNGLIVEFPLASNDISDKFQIPQKLYGREDEINHLLTAFEQTSQGNTEIIVVAGYAGVGKSALVNEFHRLMTAQKGNFVTGKFDQYQRNTPYYALSQALNEFCNQLLAESSEKLEEWKQKILNAVGNNGQVLIDVIPHLEFIIGPQPDVASVGPKEAQNRFNLVFQNFIKAISQSDRPLVLFIDDLQWADIASLALLKTIIVDQESKYLLIVGAYRDNEVNVTHPLIEMLEDIKKIAPKKLSFIQVNNLSIENINNLVSDALSCSLTYSRPLTELVYEKTQGNSFFTAEFLKTLYAEALLTFERKKRKWQWNVAQIQAKNITDNVVELMANKIDKLEESTQTALQLAACIGNTFDLATLSIISQDQETDILARIFPAIKQGFLVPLDSKYKLIENSSNRDEIAREVKFKFQHDRVQQAAYSLIADTQKKSTHLKIGRLLLASTIKEELETNVFDIVNHLNKGLQLVNDDREKIQFAELNLMAGQNAKTSNAYTSASKYLDMGLRLLPESSWNTEYDLTLNLYVEQVETQYLNVNFEQAEKLAEIVLNYARTVLEKVRVYETKIQFYTAQNQMKVALNIGLHVLNILGIELAENAPEDLIIETLYKLPAMTDPIQRAAMQILMAIVPPAYLANPGFFPKIIFTMLGISNKHGNSPPAVFAYSSYGLLLCGSMGNIELGYRFGKLALWILEAFDAREIKCRGHYIFNSLIRHWKEPEREATTSLQKAIHIGLETGDITYACFASVDYCSNIFLIGEPLEFVSHEQEKYITLIQTLKQEFPLYYAKIWGQLTLNFTDASADRKCLLGPLFNEIEMLPVLQQANNLTALLSAYLSKIILNYFFRNYAEAILNADLVEKYEYAVVGLFTSTQNSFYFSLALLALYPTAESKKQTEYLEKIILLQRNLAMWAENAPMNFQHKYMLVEAEKARVLEKFSEATIFYEQAIKGAKESGYIHEEALANELAAEFYLNRGLEKVAQVYLLDAHYGYIRWQATAKVKDLEERYPQWFNKSSSAIAKPSPTTSDSGKTAAAALDLESVLKASQALSEEIVLDTLLAKMIKIVIENAGAEKGYLILDKSGQWSIEAEGRLDFEDTVVLQSIRLQTLAETAFPKSILNYVARTRANIVLNNASHEGHFTQDSYVVAHRPKSILTTPIVNHGKLIGMLYLENNLTTGAFTCDRIEVLKLLCSQVAISLENALLYSTLEKANQQLEDYSHTLEKKVEERTKELKAAQKQIIAREKLASLGALTAGIAHEIRNPLNFVKNYAEGSIELTDEAIEAVEQQAEYLDEEAFESLKEILVDVRENAAIINEHSQRAENIIKSMVQHARTESGDRKPSDVNDILDRAVQFAYHGIRARNDRFNLHIETNYDRTIEHLSLAISDISRAFINLIDNACYAIASKINENEASFVPMLWIQTCNCSDIVEIHIRDNGPGIAPEIREKIFHPFFTTKPTGEGTGLGLSLTHDIIVEQHGGTITVETAVGKYAEFTITLPKTI